MPDLRLRALQLLTRRDHSRAELEKKLRNESESEETLSSFLDELSRQNLLSDQRFAKQRVSARGSRYGNGRLKQELRQHGISEEDISEALPEAGDELTRCRLVWAKKFGALPTSPEERVKQLRFLQYRGFSSDSIRRTLRTEEE